ncbi:FAD-binding domain-containing protein [Bimuria novae-zelandiae CBS 107.79]|uniref:FAD-binding domain-containing protein n=1 Tax=Bimuria novae-zelandiae CBS 107.79 TaxID=1447943 RepID=A0A6A5UX97_9PLEO|nr:FAD-binding domain-containing protein [Bimuria novae-zelandiae CBS 107.79]
MAFRAVLEKVLPDKHAVQGSELYDKINGAYLTCPRSGRFDRETEIQPGRPRTPLAIKGTGHTSFAGAANVQDGITIASQGLKGLRLCEDKGQIAIGVGETWGSVYTELEKHGLTVPGGRVGRVDVPGLILGGGMSFYSTKHGFACDSVLDLEVVLASGEIIHANAKQNSDLFVCLKGGLNNFGVVASI